MKGSFPEMRNKNPEERNKLEATHNKNKKWMKKYRNENNRIEMRWEE